MSPGPDPTDCVQAAFGGPHWGPGVSKCADTSTVFSENRGEGWAYIQYCIRYTKLTNEYRANVLSTADRSCVDDSHVDTSVATAVRVVDTIVPCLTAYCEASTACKTQDPFPCYQESLATDGTLLNMDTVDSCMDQICASHPALRANQDIAGIGMIASYIIQTGIALLIALSLFFLTIRSQNRKASMATNLQIWSRDGHSESSAEPVHDALGKHKLYKSLRQALVAFLLAQNFLALAISIAALQTLNSPGVLGPLDEVALGSASGSVILPTVFGLYTLASFYRGSQSWYLFTLSLLVWVLGFSIALGPQMLRLSAQNRSTSLLYAKNAESPQVCGNVPPYSICPNALPPDLHPEYAFYYTLCLPVILGLTIWQLSSLNSFSSLLNRILPKNFRAKWQRLLFLMMHLGAVGFLAAPSYFFFQSISDLLSNDAVNMTWGFGQIVAILATVPTVVEFVHTYVENNRSPHVRRIAPGSLAKNAYEPLELDVGSSGV